MLSLLIIPAGAFVAWTIAGYAAGGDPFYWIGRRIWLIDHQGEVYASRYRVDKNGVAWAYVYPISRTGHVVLLGDGSTSGESFYIDRWSYARPAKEDQSVEARNARSLKGAR